MGREDYVSVFDGREAPEFDAGRQMQRSAEQLSCSGVTVFEREGTVKRVKAIRRISRMKKI